MLNSELRNRDFPGGPVVKSPSSNAKITSSIPGPGRSSGKGAGYPPQYSGLKNSMDRGAWLSIVHRVAESTMAE